MPLVPVNNFSDGSFLINSIDASCQVTDLSAQFVAQEVRSVTLCSEPYGTGDKGEVRCVLAITFKVMTGQDAIAGYLASNPFDIPVVAQWDTSATVTGDFNWPTVSLPRIAGAALTFGSAVGTNNGPYIIAWPDGTVTS
jgi:hypothetical protein